MDMPTIFLKLILLFVNLIVCLEQQRDHTRRQEALMNHRREQQELDELEQQTPQQQIFARTTAAPRPNAYIPDDLGIIFLFAYLSASSLFL